MKIFKPFYLALALGVVATSCGDDDDNGGNDGDNPDSGYLPNGSVISGDITGETKLKEGYEYTLAGGVHVKDGGSIVIEEGVMVKNDVNEAVAYLLVEQGGMINAQGTAANPIVFTSGASNPARGDWGGIIICGKAPINKGETATAEVGDAIYGGTESNDNSGTLRYVRLEYTGNAINDQKEHNGFTFNGVGSGTTLEYLQVFMGGDDGFEWFGGTVNAKYLVSTGSKDDSFDWTYGWQGNVQYMVAEQAADVADRGFEGDNQSGLNDADPYSMPTLANITLVGAGSNGDQDAQAMKLREGTKGNIRNFVAINFNKRGVQVEHDVTCNNWNAGDLMVANGFVQTNNSFVWSPTAAINQDVNWSDVTEEDVAWLNGISGISETNAMNPATLNGFFDAAEYVGAVDPANDWTTGWVLNVDGSVR